MFPSIRQRDLLWIAACNFSDTSVPIRLSPGAALRPGSTRATGQDSGVAPSRLETMDADLVKCRVHSRPQTRRLEFEYEGMSAPAAHNANCWPPHKSLQIIELARFNAITEVAASEVLSLCETSCLVSNSQLTDTKRLIDRVQLRDTTSLIGTF